MPTFTCRLCEKQRAEALTLETTRTINVDRGRPGSKNQLVGFVNVAWDGSSHAFILDTVVARAQQRGGVGVELVAVTAREATAAGCEWLHVDFEDHLRSFYFDGCRFRPTNAGLRDLKGG